MLTSIHSFSNPSLHPQLHFHPHSHPELKQQHYLIPTLEHDFRSGMEGAGGGVSAASRIIRDKRREKQKSEKKNMKLALSPSVLHYLCGPDGLSHKLAHQSHQVQLRQQHGQQWSPCNNSSNVHSVRWAST